MMNVPISQALLLYDSGITGGAPRFAVRPIGHSDYDRYFYKVGACFNDWQKETDPNRLKLRLLIEVWHSVAFYGVPAEMAHEALLAIPEYRDMLAGDCLPRAFQHERE